MIKRNFDIFYVCLVSVILTSCNEPNHSVEWYKQHDAERELMLNRCKANPDLMTKDKNCQNAAAAQFQSGGYTPSPKKDW